MVGRNPGRATREALRPRPRILASGVMEFWSTGVLRIVGIAPRGRRVGSAFRAHRFPTVNPGIKSWAKSYRPFGAENALRVGNSGSVGRDPSLSPVTFHILPFNHRAHPRFYSAFQPGR